MNNASKLNINILWDSDATVPRNDIRRIKFAVATCFSLYPKFKIKEERKGREKRYIQPISNISLTARINK